MILFILFIFSKFFTLSLIAAFLYQNLNIYSFYELCVFLGIYYIMSIL
jgi:hypothetical protein